MLILYDDTTAFRDTKRYNQVSKKHSCHRYLTAGE
jgi:hypothetical protein